MAERAFFEGFCLQMRPCIVRFIRVRLPTDLAEDLANETFLTLWRKNLPVPTGEVELRQRRQLTYLIASGHIRNAARRLAARQEVGFEAAERQLEAQRLDLDPTFESVMPTLLREVVEGLDLLDRQVIRLRLDGYNSRETATILGLSHGAASMRIGRARRRLKDLLSLRAHSDSLPHTSENPRRSDINTVDSDGLRVHDPGGRPSSQNPTRGSP